MFILGSYHRTGTKFIKAVFNELKELKYKFIDHFDRILDDEIKNNKCLVIIRHPYEIIMSGVRAHQLDNQKWLLESQERFNYNSYREMMISKTLDNKIIFELENEGGLTLKSIYNDIKNRNFNNNILFIKLENFYTSNNLDEISKKIISHLNLKIENEKLVYAFKKHINKKYNMTNKSNSYTFEDNFKRNHYKLCSKILPPDILEVIGYGKTSNIIVFSIDKKNKIYGGYGDRIVGLIGTYMLSINLNKDFFIKWSIDPLNKYFNFKNINEMYHDEKLIKQRIFIMDNIKKHKNIIKKKWSELKNKNYFISSNLNLNELLPIKTNDLILGVWNSFYDNILSPKEILLYKLNDIPNNLIGIQVRAGDNWMKTGSKHKPIKDIKDIKIYLTNIKNYLDKNLPYNKVFITSDYPKINDIGKEIFREKLFLYTENQGKHLEKNNLNDDDYIKLYLDHIILSKKCKILFISKYSNYGRTAGLINNNSEIYDMKTLEKLSKEELLTK